MSSPYATLAPGATHEQVEKIMLAEIEKMKNERRHGRGSRAGRAASTSAADAYARDGTGECCELS